MRRGLPTVLSIWRIVCDQRATWAGSVIPNTARRMTSSVIACIEAAVSISPLRGHAATWRSATSRIVSP